MRNAIVVFLAVILMAGCIDIDITAPQIEEERVVDTMPVIVLSPAANPNPWVHPGSSMANAVTFFAPANVTGLEFDVTSDTPEVATIVDWILSRYEDPSCSATGCETVSYVLWIFVSTGRIGQAKISYTLRGDGRVTGHFTLHVDPRG